MLFVIYFWRIISAAKKYKQCDYSYDRQSGSEIHSDRKMSTAIWWADLDRDKAFEEI